MRRTPYHAPIGARPASARPRSSSSSADSFAPACAVAPEPVSGGSTFVPADAAGELDAPGPSWRTPRTSSIGTSPGAVVKAGAATADGNAIGSTGMLTDCFGASHSLSAKFAATFAVASVTAVDPTVGTVTA